RLFPSGDENPRPTAHGPGFIPCRARIQTRRAQDLRMGSPAFGPLGARPSGWVCYPAAIVAAAPVRRSPVGMRMTFRPLVLAASMGVALGLTACSATYYNTMEKFGFAK